MRNLDKASEELINWIKKLSLIEHSFEHCRKYIRTYQENEPEEFKRYFADFQYKMLNLKIHSIEYHINLTKNMPDSIHISLIVIYGSMVIAQYKAFFKITGEFFDDSWSFSIAEDYISGKRG